MKTTGYAGRRSSRLNRRHKQRGAVSIIVAASIVLLIGVVGIAVDSGLGYMVKAKLDAAADAAAIAAGEAVTTGSTQAAQAANAIAAANSFFAANYPAGYLGTTATLNAPSVVFNQGTITIDTSAQASMPVGFMHLFGFNLLNVASASETVRKDLDLVLIIDTTGSMATDPAVPPAVRSAAITFLQQFDPLTDRVSLIHFAYGTVVDQPFNGNARGFDMAAMTKSINAFNFAGSTNSEEAYWNALNQLNTVITQPSSLRVIVFFSDGAPNSFASIFPTKNQNCNSVAGTIISGDTPSTPAALYADNVQSQQLSSPCYNNNASKLITQLPTWYNAHNTSWLNNQTIPVITNTPRVVTSTVNYANVNNAGRNIAEAMANLARSEGTYVYAIGRGSELLTPEGANGEIGQNVLMCMANTANSLPRCYNPKQPVGVYCSALTPADMTPCFSRLASEILRIAK
ncbi:Flp pilus assembly protein TadG [Paraburkholderia sp. BL23I1N1]|uniref:VWA domain-containing protein n=1 Tax=Paraburkholderia sp. BL23I1N1 TaxID=1938802 RepID=UPI000E758E42|nr:vWA domain-containing protein [Paraburkholderia sp. BL23I1N1]RKE25929.1 Flp pilus assembly protein TadG [Paraburkholderia sp. BL23I1N1]